jgi:NADPH:quinone reductase-like Zn-dependent oxidoreductase
MRALVVTAFGGPENFVLKEIPKPDVQDGTLAIEGPVIVAIPVDYRDNHRFDGNFSPACARLTGSAC